MNFGVTAYPFEWLNRLLLYVIVRVKGGIIVDHTMVAKLQESLKRYCLSLTENHWDAEDLAQEAWTKALSVWKFNDHANPQALLLRIARNAWIDHARKYKLYMRYMDLQRKEPQLEPDSDLLQLEIIFQALMKHLTPLQRAVFLLKDVYDLSIMETAHCLQTTQGAVKAALHRARQSVEGVKRELEENTLSLPHEVDNKWLLRNLAIAYELGDMARVLELAVEEGMEPMVAVSIANNEKMRVTSAAAKRGNIQGRCHFTSAA